MRISVVLLLLLLAGCGKQPVPQLPPREEPKLTTPQVEVKIGGDQDEARHLAFKIIAIHEDQEPSSDVPYHTKGGEWTYFDCQSKNDSKVVFTVAVVSKKTTTNVPISWGKATLILKDRDSAARFVELFSKAFVGKLPSLMNQVGVPKPLSINTAILGSNLDRESLGGFSGAGGGWTATKWFPSHDDKEAEVYFNYNLRTRQGEFSEKDADYADDLVAIFAAALRDAPRPERTPENDPSLTITGPAIGTPRTLVPRTTSFYSFSPLSKFVVYCDDKTIFALSLEQPDSKPFEIAQFEHSPWDIHVLNENLDMLVQEGVAESPGVKSSSDPMRLWWVDGKKKEKKLLRGLEKGISMVENAVSPDRRFVVLSQWKGDVRKEGRKKFLYILDRESGKSITCDSNAKDLSVIGWRTTNTGLRMVAITNRWQNDEKAGSESYLVDPATGKSEREENVDARSEIDNILSPDGKRRVRVGKDELIVSELADGAKKRFAIHEYDRRYLGSECIEWVSPRYLKFNGPRLALIDVATMKMSFPVAADGTKFASHAFKFSSDFRWALYQGEVNGGSGLFLAPVEMPKLP